MKKQNKQELMTHLEQYGYPLMQPALTAPPEKVLKELLNQNDLRLLEGFPVVLANVLRETTDFSWENAKWRPAKEFSKPAEHRLTVMLVLTYLLLRLFGFEKEYGPRVLKMVLRCKQGSDLLPQLTGAFLKSQPVKMGAMDLSTERLKNNFRQYVVHAAQSEGAHKKQRTLELELLLSELFTPRQKELLKKRQQNKLMTKTEREYFYRVVKKRLKALANDELHQMARNLLMR